MIERGLRTVALAVIAGAASCHEAPVPAPPPAVVTPRPVLPILPILDDVELIAQLDDAIELYRRESFDRWLDAVDPGELLEHATITQATLDRGIHGLDALFVFGDELFDYEFRIENGLGNGLSSRNTLSGALPAPNRRVVHEGDFGGPDSHACSGCHSKGGLDGAGTATQNAFLRGDGVHTRTADVRNPPHLLGLGPIEALAAEMTAELKAQVAAARQQAAGGEPAIAILTSKGVGFGVVEVRPGGELDMSRVQGVDADLVIRPFGWKGHQATIRGMSEESFRIHMGIVSMTQQERARDGALGDAERGALGDGVWHDIDRDGVSLEIDDGMLTSMAAYLAQLEVPVMRPPVAPRHVEAFARGSALFDSIGCGVCHRRELIVQNPVIEIRAGQRSHADRPPIRVDVAQDGEQPKVEAVYADRSSYRVALLSDLKRHDMGPELAAPAAVGSVAASVWLTRPLWGLADTAPYLHDGRAPTVHDAIALHGGEGAAARDAYLALGPEDRGAVQVFLMSLTRTPKLVVP